MQITETTDLLTLFRHHKLDTEEIANLTGMSEAQAYNAIHKQREQENARSRARAYGREYQRKQRALDKQKAPRLVSYAGTPALNEGLGKDKYKLEFPSRERNPKSKKPEYADVAYDSGHEVKAINPLSEWE